MSLYYLGNARNDEQAAEMRRLESEAKCLFCPQHLGTGPEHRILTRTASWSVTENRYPYRGARLHLLLVPDRHVADLLDLPDEILADFWVALAWVKQKYALEYYGIGVRCGDCRYTGGTIQHLHVHVVVGDVDDPRHEGIRLKLSSRPAPNRTDLG